jgi:MoxR-like ATPase
MMARHTKPDELFGAVDVLAMSNGCSPQAASFDCHIAFLDEIWKSSSAIVNTLRRSCKSGSSITMAGSRVPLRLVISPATNGPVAKVRRYGGGIRRFLIRRTVKPVSEAMARSFRDCRLQPSDACRTRRSARAGNDALQQDAKTC